MLSAGGSPRGHRGNCDQTWRERERKREPRAGEKKTVENRRTISMRCGGGERGTRHERTKGKGCAHEKKFSLFPIFLFFLPPFLSFLNRRIEAKFRFYFSTMSTRARHSSESGFPDFSFRSVEFAARQPALKRSLSNESPPPPSPPRPGHERGSRREIRNRITRGNRKYGANKGGAFISLRTDRY